MASPEAQGPAFSGEQNCIFCHIINGRVPAKEVYSDSKVKAILDINPANPGHVLILPKEHYLIFPQVPEDVLGYLAMVSKAISKACIRALKVQGTNIFIANGAAAGQKAQHVMIHVVPRKEADGLQAFALPHRQLPDEAYAKLSTVLKERVEKTLGAKAEEKPAAAQGTPPAIAPQPVPSAPRPIAPQPAPLPPSTATSLPKSTVDLDTIADLFGGAPRRVEQEREDREQHAESSEQFPYIASKRGGKFHLRTCPFINKINPENRIELRDRDEARERELKPCECVRNESNL